MNATNRRDRNERDRLVTVACAEGRFPRSRMGHYLAAYDRDPEGTRVLLTADEKDGGLARGLPRDEPVQATERGAGLTSNDAALLEASRAKMGGDLRAAADVMASKYDRSAMAASVSADGVPGTLEDLGLLMSEPPVASSSAPGVVGASGVAVDAYGTMTFGGLPVSLSADGTPLVHVSAGPMTIDSLKSLGVDLEYERLLAASRSRMGVG